MIAYIYPELNTESRTLRVRFDLPNPELKLRPGMFVDVEQTIDLGEGIAGAGVGGPRHGGAEDRLRRDGPRRLEPRDGRPFSGGARARRRSLRGVAAGEQVAVKANFLLDSESRLRGALAARRRVRRRRTRSGHSPRADR